MDENTYDESEVTPEASEQITRYQNNCIYDEFDVEIVDPDLDLGYLKNEEITYYHAGSAEQGHYYVSFLELNTGESFHLQDGDERIEILNPAIGSFKYLPIEDNPSISIKSAAVRYVIDHPAVPAWNETVKFFRYILYTEKELADQKFLADGPERLDSVESDTIDLLQVVADLAGSDIEERVAESQETIDELLLVVADLLGGTEEEA